MTTPQYLDRREASKFLSERGQKVAHTTLAKYATTGGGPPMRKFGRRVLYDRQVLVDWADSKLSAPIRSTSDGNAHTKQSATTSNSYQEECAR